METKEENKKLVEDFLKDERRKQEAQLLAKQIYEDISKNWFSPSRLSKKGKIPLQEAIQKLELLRLFGFAIRKVEKQDILYKIILKKEDHLQFLLSERLLLETQLKALDSRIKQLQETL